MNLEDKYKILVEALKEISQMKGAYRIDPHEHAQNVIEYNQGVAVEALNKVGEPVEGFEG